MTDDEKPKGEYQIPPQIAYTLAEGGDTKLIAAFRRILDEAAKITPESRESMLGSLAKCANEMRRAVKRAATLPAEVERVELVPTRGPVVEFSGRMLRQDAFDVAAGKVRLEVWQTEGGSLVAVDSFDDGERGERIKVCTPSGGIEDQRMAIMEFFGWTNRARSIARKLGWSVRRDIE